MAKEIYYTIRWENDYGPRFDTVSLSEDIEESEYERLLFCSKQEQENFIRNRFRVSSDAAVINICIEKLTSDEYLEALLRSIASGLKKM